MGHGERGGAEGGGERGVLELGFGPFDSVALPLIFHARTQDFQDVTVQATVTYRFTDPALVSKRLDFGVEQAGLA